MNSEKVRRFHFGSSIGSLSVPIKKNMSWVRQIQDINKACDDDQMEKT